MTEFVDVKASMDIVRKSTRHFLEETGKMPLFRSLKANELPKCGVSYIYPCSVNQSEPPKFWVGVHLTKILTTQSKSAEFGVALDRNKHLCNTVKSKHYWGKNMYVFTIVEMQQVLFFRN